MYTTIGSMDLVGIFFYTKRSKQSSIGGKYEEFNKKSRRVGCYTGCCFK